MIETEAKLSSAAGGESESVESRGYLVPDEMEEPGKMILIMDHRELWAQSCGDICNYLDGGIVMEEKRELKNKKLKLEELENVDGGYDFPNPYSAPQVGSGLNKRHFTCRCGFQTSSPEEYASHIARNPDHPFMNFYGEN